MSPSPQKWRLEDYFAFAMVPFSGSFVHFRGSTLMYWSASPSGSNEIAEFIFASVRPGVGGRTSTLGFAFGRFSCRWRLMLGVQQKESFLFWSQVFQVWVFVFCCCNLLIWFVSLCLLYDSLLIQYMFFQCCCWKILFCLVLAFLSSSLVPRMTTKWYVYV